MLGFLPMWLLACALLAVASPAKADSASGSYASPEALIFYSRGLLLEQQGDFDSALAHFFRAVSLDPKAVGPARHASDLSARQGNYSQSLEFAERALAVAPDDPRSLWLEGAALFNLGRAAEAMTALQRAAEGDSENVEYWRSLARVAEHERDIDMLVRARRKVVELDDGDEESWFQLAGALARRGEFPEADSVLHVVREMDPTRPGLDFLQGWVSEGLEHDDDAIASYRRHLAQHPDDSVTRQRVVALLAQHDHWAEAYKEARKVTERNPEDPEALETEADLAFKSGHTSAGFERLKDLERVDPDAPDNTGRAILVLARNKRSADGVRAARAWGGAHPDDYRGALLESRALALADSIDGALARAHEAIEMVPDSVGPRVLYGRIAQQEKRWALAASAWAELLQRRPKQVGVALDLAICREQMGDVDGAVSAARDALSWAPTNPTAQNFLGYMLADHDRELGRAQHLIEQALAQDPDNGAFIDSLGWVYYRQGKLAEARVQLERAARLTRGDPTVLEHLGDVYRDLRLTDLARAQYRRSLAADSSNQRVRNKLEALR